MVILSEQGTNIKVRGKDHANIRMRGKDHANIRMRGKDHANIRMSSMMFFFIQTMYQDGLLSLSGQLAKYCK